MVYDNDVEVLRPLAALSYRILSLKTFRRATVWNRLVSQEESARLDYPRYEATCRKVGRDWKPRSAPIQSKRPNTHTRSTLFVRAASRRKNQCLAESEGPRYCVASSSTESFAHR